MTHSYFAAAGYIQGKSVNIHEEGMTISVMYGPREDLYWKMPNGESRRFFTPKPDVDPKTPAAVQPHQTQPASTDRKRKALPQPEMPAKRIKTDKVCPTISYCF